MLSKNFAKILKTNEETKDKDDVLSPNVKKLDKSQFFASRKSSIAKSTKGNQEKEE